MITKGRSEEFAYEWQRMALSYGRHEHMRYLHKGLTGHYEEMKPWRGHMVKEH